MHKIVTHQYFLDDMNYGDLSIILKYLEYADVIAWSQTRELMYTVMAPYLKNKNTTAKDILKLPTDQVEEHIVNHEISNEEVAWYKKFKENYEKEHQAK